MERTVIRSLKSVKNDNEYVLFEDKIEVKTRSGTVEIPMVTHTSSYMYELQFCEILYMSGKLYVVVATRGAYDEKYEIDEDTLELIGPTPFY